MIREVLVFVEVRFGGEREPCGAIEAVDVRRVPNRIQLAAQYLAQHRIRNRACWFDVVLIQDKAGSAEAVQHITNVFVPRWR